MQAASIVIRDLACRRGDRLLFRGLDAEVNAGAALQVAGRNGIGKSSLLRILAGLAPAYAGSVATSGTIGMIDERHALDPAHALGHALAFWRALDGGDLDRSDRASSPPVLERLGLAELTDVPVRYLSTGQKKRAALARLIGQRAAIWLLDEPLNGLDSEALELTETLIGEHCAAGGIAVIASHQPLRLANLASIALADYVPAPGMDDLAEDGAGEEAEFLA
ncbi:heme ABC exporter ATP-binding protein CcmA [Novosphingobium sp. YJ-S2-02]|uniref:Heme ABC exporter ATP-binding protein CcmA n=1 Tax=Novosphingobium aureum TaxID=2792964 RepID=A0A931HB72_9SPHN|nr:heme ABC exporter ATP-binding protein CcmA [Novosphingobium aureum]MBH0112266.1 heme ABC exporter ATP-binding protein CcmA [Novosphingobium aureum]